MTPEEYHNALTERHTRHLANADNFAQACVDLAKHELTEVDPDFPAAAKAMIANGMPIWEAYRIIGKIIDHVYPLAPIAEARELERLIKRGRNR